MNNDNIIKLALEAGLINYVDLETPRFYFVHGNIEMDEIEYFAKTIVKECAKVSENYACGSMPYSISLAIKNHFGIEE